MPTPLRPLTGRLGVIIDYFLAWLAAPLLPIPLLPKFRNSSDLCRWSSTRKTWKSYYSNLCDFRFQISTKNSTKLEIVR